MSTNRHPVPDTESYTLVDETNAAENYVAFVSFGPVNRYGYRGCGVFSCATAEVAANIAALKKGGTRVFRKSTNLEY